MHNPEQTSRAIYYQLSDIYEISAIYFHDGRLILRAKPLIGREEAFSLLHRRLNNVGFTANVREDANGILIAVRQAKKVRLPVLNIILFLATLVTMFLAPALLSLDFHYFDRPGVVQERAEFTIALMAILLFHEFGHYLAGRRRGVFMSLPYFIPAPNIVGTFGAVIKSKSPFTNRRDLIEVGAAGPIAGFVISVIAIAVGLSRSEIIPPDFEGGMRLGDSLLIKLLSWLIIGPIPEGYDFMLSPAAFAGWVGLLVTMINLLLLGQLDGGHILYGLLGSRQHQIGRFFLIVMMVLGFWWPGWWFFGALVFLFGINHPPTYNDSQKLTGTARAMAFIAIFIFVVSFVPAPFILD